MKESEQLKVTDLRIGDKVREKKTVVRISNQEVYNGSEVSPCIGC